MRRAVRVTGLLMIAGGVFCLAWALVVWRWQDPFTALQTMRDQGRLADQYEQLFATWQTPAEPAPAAAKQPAGAPKRKDRALRRVSPREIARAAASYRKSARQGQAIGRIVIPRLGLSMIVVEGTDSGTLRKGPGRDPRTYMPGENHLVYIAGHRTTYGAPFADIDSIRPGDPVRLEVPYATFFYRATRREIVPANAVSRLRSQGRELLRLQACHPRFFASHRYLVDAQLVRVEPRRGRAYVLEATASG